VDADRLVGLADALTGSRHWLEAAGVLRIAVAADPDEAVRYRYCRSLLQASLPRPAVEVASEILASNPQHPGTRALHAAAVLALSNDPAAALSAAEAARQPGDALLEAMIARALLWRGDRTAARQTAEAAAARYRDGGADEGATLLALAEVLGSKEGMGDEAAREECLRRVLRLGPRDPEALTAVAASCLRQSRPAEAVPLLLAALRAEPQGREAAQLLAAAGRKRQAALDPAAARERDQWLRYLQRSAFAGTVPGRLRAAMRLPMGIVPPSATVLADPTACHCAETTRLYGPLAVEYARVHLGQLHHHDGVGVIELRCPTTQAPWVGLEPGVVDDHARVLAVDKAVAPPGRRGPAGQYL
jgi:tetratricopeptide (TPR) repeat protein